MASPITNRAVEYRPTNLEAEHRSVLNPILFNNGTFVSRMFTALTLLPILTFGLISNCAEAPGLVTTLIIGVTIGLTRIGRKAAFNWRVNSMARGVDQDVRELRQREEALTQAEKNNLNLSPQDAAAERAYIEAGRKQLPSIMAKLKPELQKQSLGARVDANTNEFLNLNVQDSNATNAPQAQAAPTPPAAAEATGAAIVDAIKNPLTRVAGILTLLTGADQGAQRVILERAHDVLSRVINSLNLGRIVSPYETIANPRAIIFVLGSVLQEQKTNSGQSDYRNSKLEKLIADFEWLATMTPEHLKREQSEIAEGLRQIIATITDSSYQAHRDAFSEIIEALEQGRSDHRLSWAAETVTTLSPDLTSLAQRIRALNDFMSSSRLRSMAERLDNLSRTLIQPTGFKIDGPAQTTLLSQLTDLSAAEDGQVALLAQETKALFDLLIPLLPQAASGGGGGGGGDAAAGGAAPAKKKGGGK